MNNVYMLPINMQTSHNLTTSTVTLGKQQIISSEQLQFVEDEIAQNQMFTLEDPQSNISSGHLQFIKEQITQSQKITLENSQSNISRLDEETMQNRLITLEDTPSDMSLCDHPPHVMQKILQIQNIKSEDPFSNTIPDKATAKEIHKNLQQFIIEDALNKNTYPAPETIKTNKTENSSFKQKQQRKAAICNICHKSFVNHSKLNWHMRMHDKNRKRFECPKESCRRLYASKQSCDLHYRQTHLDEGIFCPICHKIFSVKQTLEVHMRYHTKDFPYQCNICNRKFGQKGHLTQHIEVKHENLRYICTEPDCGKIFQNSVSLKNHRYTHSSMPFKCKHCAKEYPQKNKLRVHLLRKHNLEYSLDDLESMRQFQSIRTRHTYVKVQTMEVEETVDGCSDISLPSTCDFLEELDVCM